jgi:hypothetical protein
MDVLNKCTILSVMFFYDLLQLVFSVWVKRELLVLGGGGAYGTD